MKALALAAALALAVPAVAQVQVQVQLPSISFPAPPPLVVVEPGVQVVPDQEHEVFFADGWFWNRQGPSWFRTRTHTGGWVVVEPRFVPPLLIKAPAGRYRRWKPVQVAVAPMPPPGIAYPAPQPVAPPPTQVVSVKELRAERIYARVIHCKELKARDGRIGRQGGRDHHHSKGKDKDKEWDRKELRTTELRVDTLYAKEIHADYVEAQEVYCKEVKLGR